MNLSWDELFQQGVDYFNNGYFFEAHDTFEELWIDDRDGSKLFYQGLVQMSTGFYHLVMKNFKGAESQLSKSIEKLSNYQPFYQNIDVTFLITEIEECLKQIKTTDECCTKLQARIPRIHRSINSNKF